MARILLGAHSRLLT